LKALQPSSGFLLPRYVLFPACVLFFLLLLVFGDPPKANGLDPAWTEVLAWAFVNHVKWGSALAYMYGPFGFAHPYSSYVSGAFPAFVFAQIALGAAFVLSISMIMRRARPLEFGLFALAFIVSFYRWPGELSWLLTLLFATTGLINCCRRGNRSAYVAIWALAPVFAAIALTKFSALPFAALCLAIVSVSCMLERNWRFALLIPTLFVLALIGEWLACGQALPDLPRYVATGLEFSHGYRHAMGLRASMAVEGAGLAVLFFFVGTCILAAWRARSNRAALASISLAPAAAAFLWVAYFTRADEYHWPSFFAAMSLLPFVVLRNRFFAGSRASVLSLLVVACACASMSFTVVPADAVPQAVYDRVLGSLYSLGHLRELQEQREDEWKTLADAEALPRIRERVGRARVDVVTWQQETILLNGLNYAPRPVFQSHAAYTPKLARINESYFLGPKAPDFVLFRLDYSDNRVPMSEDGLALIGLLRRYRPVLFEKTFLLLQLDPSVATADATVPATSMTRADIGSAVPVAAMEAPAVAFIDVELNLFGKLYTLFFPEPALGITIETDGGESLHYRLIRLTAASGFLMNPVVQSTHDWLHLYFSKPLARVRSLRIDSESPVDRLLFQRDFNFSWIPIEVLHADSSSAPVDLRNALYPGFNMEPVETGMPLRVVTEDGAESVFLHAPATLSFSPASGRYRIFATFGIQSSALTDPDCARASPDGVGITLVRHDGAKETPLWHGKVDPFHVGQDHGPQRLQILADFSAGDRVDFRVDVGDANNSSCDWTYLRNLKFVRSTDPEFDRVHTNGFD
jgi:hypothetical protein